MRSSPSSAPLPATLAAPAVLLALHSAVTAAAARWHALGPLLKGRPAEGRGIIVERRFTAEGEADGDLSMSLRWPTPSALSPGC
jgi:hypothetical protein